MRKALIVGLLVLGVCPTLRAENYDLRSHYKVGQVIRVRSVWESSLKLVESEPKNPTEAAGATVHSLRKSEVRYTVVKMSKGMPAVTNAEIISVAETDQAPGEAEKTASNPAVGKTIVVTTDADGKSTYAYENGKEVEKDAQDLCNDLDSELLRHIDVSSASIGQEWDVPADAARKAFDVSATGEATATARFVELLEQDGRHLARLAMTVHVKDRPEKDAAATTSMELTGECLFDLDRHMPYKASIAGDMKVTVGFPVQGHMTFEGPLTVNSELEDVTGKDR